MLLCVQVNIRNEMSAPLANNYRHKPSDLEPSPKGYGSPSQGKAKDKTSPVSCSSRQRQHHLRPLSLPKPKIILPFSHCKPLIIEDSEKTKTVTVVHASAKYTYITSYLPSHLSMHHVQYGCTYIQYVRTQIINADSMFLAIMYVHMCIRTLHIVCFKMRIQYYVLCVHTVNVTLKCKCMRTLSIHKSVLSGSYPMYSAGSLLFMYVLCEHTYTYILYKCGITL